MDPDIHWSAMSGHVSTFIVNGGRYDHIFWTEKFNEGMQVVLDNIETAARDRPAQRAALQRKRGPRPETRLHPVEDYFDDLSMHLVYEIYKRDFENSSSTSWGTSTIRRTRCRWARSTSTRCTPSWGNATQWVTELVGSTYQIDGSGGTDVSDSQRLRLRSGPQFRLTGEAFGPRLQPYVELESVGYSDTARPGYTAASVGLAYQNAHSATLTSFSDVSIGWGELDDGSNAEIRLHDLSLGLTYRPSREAFYRLTLSMGQEDTATRDEDQRGLRFDYGRTFGAPIAFSGRDWRAGAFASVDWLDITDTGVSRDETVTAAGLSLRAYLNDDVFVETRGTHLTRDGATAADETVLSMQLGLEF
jgi:hypothetical protein